MQKNQAIFLQGLPFGVQNDVFDPLFGILAQKSDISYARKFLSLSSDSPRSLRSAGHRSWQIRQPAPQSKLCELRQRARSACFVPVIRKTQNNRNFTLSPEKGLIFNVTNSVSGDYKRKTEAGCSASVIECGGRDSNSHRLTPTTPSK